MKLEKIITMANQNARLRFLAMERSLRSTGCDLPLWVIPYDQTRFDLPANATWWEVPDLRKFLLDKRAIKMMAKYQCLTTENYQYADSDVIFLRNPAVVLADEDGFITSCGHWGSPKTTYTTDSLKILRKISSCWQTRVFNAGQFACDRTLYSPEQLQEELRDPRYASTFSTVLSDQPGMVLLVNLAGVRIYNLTLPPVGMESTWAGSYPDQDYADYWSDESRKPYLLHWAGCDVTVRRPIDELFIGYLTKAERRLWDQQVAERLGQKKRNLWRDRFRKLAKASRAFWAELRQ